MATNEQHHILDLPKFDTAPKLLIVVAPYYKDIADNLVAGARAVADQVGAKVDLVEVPGALEIPSAVGMAARMADYDGFVALGCIIRGETTHYDTVCNDSSRGLTLLGLQGVCVGNGILTVENRPQAEVRANPGDQDKGGGAAAAALHLVALSRKWAHRTKGIGFKPAGEEFRIAGETKGPTTA